MNVVQLADNVVNHRSDILDSFFFFSESHALTSFLSVAESLNGFRFCGEPDSFIVPVRNDPRIDADNLLTNQGDGMAFFGNLSFANATLSFDRLCHLPNYISRI